ncbi:hypothetical protein D3C75_1045310 [compost metagenome]
MTQTPDLKRVQADLKKSEELAKKLALSLSATTKKFKQLLSKYKEQERENQRLKFEIARLQRELKHAKDQAIWSPE